MGYHGTHTPPVILRNVLENPGWYTAYTPYQAELAQGRLEALLNYQTMVCDLTAMPIANASLLDEGDRRRRSRWPWPTPPARRSPTPWPSSRPIVHPQTRAVLATRAAPLGITLVDVAPGDVAALRASQPLRGRAAIPRHHRRQVRDLHAEIALRARGGGAGHRLPPTCSPWSLLTPAGARWARTWWWVPPSGSASPWATAAPTPPSSPPATRSSARCPAASSASARTHPATPALRLALQTREQHIRREKATSNICTAQVLLAVMAGMYAVWHGPEGLTPHRPAHQPPGPLAPRRRRRGPGTTLAPRLLSSTPSRLDVPDADALMARAVEAGFNLRRLDETKASPSPSTRP